MKLVPDFVQFDFHGLGLFGQSLYEIIGKKQEVVRRVCELAAAKKWHAVILIGAPTEVMNPGLFARTQGGAANPRDHRFTASVHALQQYDARRLLLLTPFETRLNGMIEEYLTDAGFSVRAPKSFANIGEAGRLGPQRSTISPYRRWPKSALSTPSTFKAPCSIHCRCCNRSKTT